MRSVRVLSDGEECGESGAVGFDGGIQCRLGFAGAFLNAAQQFNLTAFDELEIIVGKIAPFLLEAPLEDVPVAFDFECCHKD